ncbi:Beta-ketoacyl synthase [Ophiocordyceps sinensis CO18]|uniref:Beta-ketoacyl synthase n=1 Tax=Ophiocordyceps sinensis (strain Co18 / CGMCC 3.14243) TaxID=911162 RepID=T5ACJ2_OPHSC|nr:Beta-ketoacyl synthase [Ophiocordyceps sinensis CO18]
MTQADVAIVGIACRFPGDAKCPSALGDMLMQGRDAWTKVPSSRFNVDAFYHPSQKRKASMVCKGGYFLQDDITKWDAPFFALSSTEAQAVDPQQRLLLEIAYESLENAGIPIEAVAGTDTACYVGGFNSNYKSIISRDLLDTPQYSMTGCASSMLANREPARPVVDYGHGLLELHGSSAPSMRIHPV